MKINYFKLTFFIFGILFLIIIPIPSKADTITIDASNLTYPPWEIESNYWTGNETSQQQINIKISSLISTATELYKQNYSGSEEGPLKDAYATEFFNGSNATITWNGPSYYISPPSFLLIKDGNQEPAWYLFDLEAVNWNGMETIELKNFWNTQGAISHVTLYGKISVPEPGILVLLGLGLTAVGIGSRWMRRK